MTALWTPVGLLRGSPWAAQFRLPAGAATGLLAISRPDGAGYVPLAAATAAVTGDQERTVTFHLSGADTATLPPVDALASVWIWPAGGGGRYRLFPPARFPIREPVARLIGYTEHPPPPGGTGTYPSFTTFPAADLFPSSL